MNINKLSPCCTLELSAKQSFTRDCWRKQVPPVCGDVLNANVTPAIGAESIIQRVE